MTTLRKHDVSALVGILGTLAAQLKVGFGTLHDLIPTAVGGLVVVAHQLTAFAKAEEAEISADIKAELEKLKGDVNTTVKSANEVLSGQGARMTAIGSELDMLRRTLGAVVTGTTPTPPTVNVPSPITVVTPSIVPPTP